MFDDEFDPYGILLKHEQLITSAHNNIIKITEHIDKRSKFIVELTDELNRHTDIINDQQRIIKELHNRLRLLEVARQYEKTNYEN